MTYTMKYTMKKRKVSKENQSNVKYWLITVQKDKLDEEGHVIIGHEGSIAHTMQETLRINPYYNGQEITLGMIRAQADHLGLRICIVTPVYYERNAAMEMKMNNLLKTITEYETK